jgi:hypothetical protein
MNAIMSTNFENQKRNNKEEGRLGGTDGVGLTRETPPKELCG